MSGAVALHNVSLTSSCRKLHSHTVCMSAVHSYSLYMNNVSGIPSDIIEYIETSYDKLLLELYYTSRTEAVRVIT